MQDRPTADELLAAVERFLDDEIVAGSEGARRYNARVAANALRTVRRELERRDEALAREWAGLDALLGAAERPAAHAALVGELAARTEELCARIRASEVDLDAATAHVRATVRDKLLVTNPAWLGEE